MAWFWKAGKRSEAFLSENPAIPPLHHTAASHETLPLQGSCLPTLSDTVSRVIYSRPRGVSAIPCTQLKVSSYVECDAGGYRANSGFYCEYIAYS